MDLDGRDVTQAKRAETERKAIAKARKVVAVRQSRRLS
jgi:hypothetical protein